jgi:putative alpha-1,2-mannosidase
MGLYPVCPGDDSYAAGAPLFNEINITFANGKNLQIKSDNIESAPKKISSIILNGKKQIFSQIPRSQIRNGGKLEFR